MVVVNEQLIETSLESTVGHLVLTHVKKLNVMGSELVDQFISGMDSLVEQGARVIVVRTLAGVKVWSAGYDIRELPPHGQDPLECHEPLRRAVRKMQTCPVPLIMQIEGSVWGGACELVMSADIVVAAEGASFAFTPSRLGLPYNPSGIMSFLSCIPLHVLKEMLFRAQPISAERLMHFGAINHVVPVVRLEAFVSEIALDITRTAPLANAVFKEQLTSICNSIPLTSNEFERIEASRRVVYCSEDYREGVDAIKNKRAPLFAGL